MDNMLRLFSGDRKSVKKFMQCNVIKIFILQWSFHAIFILDMSDKLSKNIPGRIDMSDIINNNKRVFGPVWCGSLD